ncbi:DUF4129 domain-containing protein [Fodinicurvata sp. EGI_FJ10296]|uniref:DUF4129 domain-containing protein n=1 Tax=Fodinicurvata sp. EGI_FJ10296 TaxID=3231908 RepID=UPI003455EB3A
MIGLALFIAMEMAWIAAVALLTDGFITGTPHTMLAAVVLAYPVATAASGQIDRLNRPVWRVAATTLAYAVVASGAIALLVPDLTAPASLRLGSIGSWLADDRAAHRSIAIAAIVGFCWVRGTMLAGRQIDGYVVGLGFQIGLAALLAVHGLAALRGIDLPGAVAVTVVFVCTGLLALWHTRAGSRDGRRRDPAGAILGLALVLIFAGAVMVALNPAVLQAGLDLLARLWSAVVAVVIWFLSLFPDPDTEPMDLPPPDAAPMSGRPEPQAPVFQPMAWMRTLFGIMFFGGFAVMIALMLLVNLRDLIAWLRQRIQRTPGLAYDRSRRRFGATFLAICAALIEGLAAWARRWRQRLTFGWTRSERPTAERRLYRTLLARLTARGWPRRASETPLEYAGRMKGTWPGTGGDMHVLTRRFMADRYGAVTRHPSARLDRLWKKIRRSLDKVPYRPDSPPTDQPSGQPTNMDQDDARRR